MERRVEPYAVGTQVTWRSARGEVRGRSVRVVRERVPNSIGVSGAPHTVEGAPAYVVDVEGEEVVRAHHEVRPA